MTATDETLLQVVDQLLAEQAPFEAVEQAERDGFAVDLWQVWADAGLAFVSVPEEAGGSGGTLTDACAVLRIVGRHAAPLPAGETALLAGWLLAAAGLPLPAGIATTVTRPGVLLPSVRRDGRELLLQGEVAQVPWAAVAERIVLLADLDDAVHVVSVPHDRDGVVVRPRRNVAGEPRDDVALHVRLDAAEVAAVPDGVDADALLQRGALARANLAAGALESTRELTVRYTGERQQFGRPVARFQAVQAHLVQLAAEAALAGAAAEVAAGMVATGADGADRAVAAAKVVAGQAATRGAAHAHQAHGAIGMTREYPLHHRTRRLWAWRDEYGSERYWSGRLGAAALRGGADDLWPSLTTGLTQH